MRTLLLLTAFALAATGCGDSTAAPAGSGGDTTQHGAPRVSTPLEHAKATKKPCGLLSEPNLKTMDMIGVGGIEEATPNGPVCTWDDTEGDSGQHITFSFMAGNGNGGLDRVYELKSTFGLFELQAPLQDYPTLLNAAKDERRQGACALVVGISDNQIFTSTVKMRTAPKPAPRVVEPCAVAREAADLALTSIREQS